MSKAETGDFAADLDTELRSARTGDCWYCANVREKLPDIDAAIVAKLATYPREKPWTAISRVLERHGCEGVNKTKVESHFKASDRAKHGRA